MAEKKTTPIVIDNVEYVYEDMTEKQQLLVNHLIDLERKLSSAKFNVDQLQVGKDAFMSMLKQDLEATPEPEAAQ